MHSTFDTPKNAFNFQRMHSTDRKRLKFCFHCCILLDKMNKIRSQLYMFFRKIKLTHHYFKLIVWFFLFFSPVRFTSVQLVLSPFFFLLGVVSPPADIVMLLCCVMLLSYEVKMSLLFLFYHPATLHPVAFSLELKLNH
jgi:hypothetical protein